MRIFNYSLPNYLLRHFEPGGARKLDGVKQDLRNAEWLHNPPKEKPKQTELSKADKYNKINKKGGRG